MTVDGLVTGSRNRKSEIHLSSAESWVEIGGAPQPTSWRARKGLPSWITRGRKFTAPRHRSILKRAPAPDVWVAPVLLAEVGKPSAS